MVVSVHFLDGDARCRSRPADGRFDVVDEVLDRVAGVEVDGLGCANRRADNDGDEGAGFDAVGEVDGVADVDLGGVDVDTIAQEVVEAVFGERLLGDGREQAYPRIGDEPHPAESDLGEVLVVEVIEDAAASAGGGEDAGHVAVLALADDGEELVEVVDFVEGEDRSGDRSSPPRPAVAAAKRRGPAQPKEKSVTTWMVLISGGRQDYDLVDRVTDTQR